MLFQFMLNWKWPQWVFTCWNQLIVTLWNMFKVNNKDTRTMSITSFCVFIVNFELILHLGLAFLFSTLSRVMPASISPVANLFQNKNFPFSILTCGRGKICLMLINLIKKINASLRTQLFWNRCIPIKTTHLLCYLNWLTVSIWEDIGFKLIRIQFCKVKMSEIRVRVRIPGI